MGCSGYDKLILEHICSREIQLCMLSNISPIHIDFTLPEKYINEIKIGLVTEIKVAAYPDHKFTGLVTAIDPLIRLDTRNVSLRATLDNKEKLLRPGMYCEVNAIIESKRQVLTLPETAIFFTPYGNSVFVLDKRSKWGKLKKEDCFYWRQVERTD